MIFIKSKTERSIAYLKKKSVMLQKSNEICISKHQNPFTKKSSPTGVLKLIIIPEKSRIGKRTQKSFHSLVENLGTNLRL